MLDALKLKALMETFPEGDSIATYAKSHSNSTVARCYWNAIHQCEQGLALNANHWFLDALTSRYGENSAHICNFMSKASEI